MQRDVSLKNLSAETHHNLTVTNLTIKPFILNFPLFVVFYSFI